MNRLLAFYRGQASDDRGRTIDQILQQDDAWFEHTHDFIQWLFPLRLPSSVNPDAPLVDAEVARAFRAEPALRRRLLDAHLRMLAFLGLRRQADGSVDKADHWPERKANWFTHDSHNSLRISRMLGCLGDLGLADDARAFEQRLQQLCDGEADAGIGPVSRAYWRNAVDSIEP